MGRATITDVRKRVSHLPEEVEFRSWGTGTNSYQLFNEETGQPMSPIAQGASDFLTIIDAFEKGRRFEKGK